MLGATIAVAGFCVPCE